MKGNKIIATLVVLAMLLSTLVVLNQLNIVNQASAQPGVDEWGDATTDLEYGVSYSSVLRQFIYCGREPVPFTCITQPIDLEVLQGTQMSSLGMVPIR